MGVTKGILELGQKAVGALDMSHEARMARAKEMGFDTDNVYYHGTTKDFDGFETRTTRRGKEVPHFFSPSPEVASKFSNAEYILGSGRPVGDDAPMVIPALLRANNTFDFRNPEHLKLLEGVIPPQKIDYIANGEFQALESKDTLDALKSLGFDSFHVMEGSRKQSFVDADRTTSPLFPNTPEGIEQAREFYQAKMDEWGRLGMGYERYKPEIIKSGDGFAIQHQGDTFSSAGEQAARDYVVNTAVFDPANIRSVNAAFDPAKKDSSNLLASLAGAGVLAGAMLPSEDAEASFIGQMARTFSKKALDKAEEMERLGFSRDQIWQETGAMGSPTFRDVDGHWKQEIDDSGFQPRPLWDEADPNYSTSSNTNEWMDWRDESADRNDGVPIGRGYELGALADAYPQLQTTRVQADGGSAFGGSYNPEENLITLPSNDALLGLDETLWRRYEEGDVARTTPIHELQHAIQHKEGFARGGSPSASQFILERAHKEAVEPYQAGWAAHSRLSGELGDLYKADYITKLDELSRKEGIKPSQITNMSDYYQYSDVLREKFGTPPTKPGPERDAWYQSAAAFFKKRALDNVSWAQRDLADDFTGNRKELQSRIRKLERQRGKYQDDARQRSALDRKFDQAKQMSDREVYQHLAGEAEARNVEKRLNMSMDERISTPPWQTLDVDENKLIVHGSKAVKPALAALATGAAAAPTTAAELVQSTPQLGQVDSLLLSAALGDARPDVVQNIEGSPALLSIANAIEDNTQSPLGDSHFQGIVDLLRKWGYREQASPLDYGMAALDVAP